MISKKDLKNCAYECLFSAQLFGWHVQACTSKNARKSIWLILVLRFFFKFLDSMIDDANYCRNTDSSSKPWCYVQAETGLVKEYCNIPSCGQWLFNIVKYWKSQLYNCIKIISSWKFLLHFFYLIANNIWHLHINGQ